MKLRLFRSLVGQASSRRSVGAPHFAKYFDGIEVSLEQLMSNPAMLDECAERDLRMVCRCQPIADAYDAEAQLDRLSSQLSSRSAEAAGALELVVLTAPAGAQLDEALGHLRDIQPFWSQFLEAHKTVGSRHGKRNAHGKPLNHHVLGVCQRLDFTAAGELAELVEILTPTRVALTTRNLAASLELEPSALAAAAPAAALPGL